MILFSLQEIDWFVVIFEAFEVESNSDSEGTWTPPIWIQNQLIIIIVFFSFTNTNNYICACLVGVNETYNNYEIILTVNTRSKGAYVNVNRTYHWELQLPVLSAVLMLPTSKQMIATVLSNYAMTTMVRRLVFTTIVFLFSFYYIVSCLTLYTHNFFFFFFN
jgi:hypothetical protein